MLVKGMIAKEQDFASIDSSKKDRGDATFVDNQKNKERERIQVCVCVCVYLELSVCVCVCVCVFMPSICMLVFGIRLCFFCIEFLRHVFVRAWSRS